jgi:uracil-DNA glycosylase
MIGTYTPNNGHLIKWAEQGVMLLNTVLTVEAKKSKSHAKKRMGDFYEQCHQEAERKR